VAGRSKAEVQVGTDATLDALEREHVLRVLARVSNLDEAARILGIDASTLWRKRKKYGV
jgi:two-component system, NtrC family, response regulator AlgB